MFFDGPLLIVTGVDKRVVDFVTASKSILTFLSTPSKSYLVFEGTICDLDRPEIQARPVVHISGTQDHQVASMYNLIYGFRSA